MTRNGSKTGTLRPFFTTPCTAAFMASGSTFCLQLFLLPPGFTSPGQSVISLLCQRVRGKRLRFEMNRICVCEPANSSSDSQVREKDACLTRGSIAILCWTGATRGGPDRCQAARDKMIATEGPHNESQAA